MLASRSHLDALHQVSNNGGVVGCHALDNKTRDSNHSKAAIRDLLSLHVLVDLEFKRVQFEVPRFAQTRLAALRSGNAADRLE